jgi:DNA-binding GntR family transcriptional regulator
MQKDLDEFFAPVSETSLRDQVADSIRRAIDAGVLSPGQRLVEAEIANQMGTSRAPVREAIRLLEQEGIVNNIPRRGSFIVKLENKDIEEIYSLRSVLESLAVREALPLSDEVLTELQGLVDEMYLAAETNDMVTLVERDLDFHKCIVINANHSRLLDVWQRMSAQLRLFLAMKDRLYENPGDVAETHIPLLEALRDGDIEMAQSVLGEHIVEAGEMLLSSLGNNKSV